MTARSCDRRDRRDAERHVRNDERDQMRRAGRGQRGHDLDHQESGVELEREGDVGPLALDLPAGRRLALCHDQTAALGSSRRNLYADETAEIKAATIATFTKMPWAMVRGSRMALPTITVA